jgi:predicted nucleic acid-binding protein
MSPRKVVLDTDVILDHLTAESHELSAGGSVMRRAMSRFFCYTTVFNAIELFALCETRKQTQAMESALGALKILGLNGKSGPSVGAVLRKARARRLRDFDTLIAGICIESRLPLMTGRPGRYRGIRSLRIFRAKSGIKSANTELFGA